MKDNSKRFWIFAYEKYYPKGGMDDFWGSYDHPSVFYQELMQDAEDKNYDGLYSMDIIQVFDTEKNQFYVENLIDGIPEKELII